MKYTKRVELNRAAFDAIEVAEADGLFAFAQEVLGLATAFVADAPPYGKGLVEGGGAIAYVGRKKVAGTTIGGKQIKKPRQLKTSDGDIVAIVGFGFPARFLELGTIDTPAEPFLTRAVYAAFPNADVTISKQTARRLAGMRDARAAARFG